MHDIIPPRAAIDLTERGLLLTDLNADDVAAHLIPLPWAARARWLDDAIHDSLAWVGSEIGRIATNLDGSRHWTAAMAGRLRKKVGAVLDLIDQRAPSLVDEHAMTLYRVSDDAGRIEQTRRHWRTRFAEAEAMAPVPGIAALCHLSHAAAKHRAMEVRP